MPELGIVAAQLTCRAAFGIIALVGAQPLAMPGVFNPQEKECPLGHSATCGSSFRWPVMQMCFYEP